MAVPGLTSNDKDQSGGRRTAKAWEQRFGKLGHGRRKAVTTVIAKARC